MPQNRASTAVGTFVGSEQNYYQSSMTILEKMAKRDHRWSNFNRSDPGITLLEQLCLMLTDVEYRLLHNMTDLMGSFQTYRQQVAAISGVRYCWFRPKDEQNDSGEKCKRLSHNLYILLEPGEENIAEQEAIVAKVQHLLRDVEYLDCKDVQIVGSCPLLLKRVDQHSTLPFYSAREVFCGYPVSESDFRRIIMDIVGVNNAWLQSCDDPGEFDIIYELSDELDVGEVEYNIRETVQKYRPLGTVFRKIRQAQQKKIHLELSVDLGVNSPADLQQVGLSMVDYLASKICPSIKYSGLKELTAEERQLTLSGPQLRSGYLTQSTLDCCSPKDTIKASDLRHALTKHFSECLDFVRKLKIIDNDSDGSGAEVLIDVSIQSPKLVSYKVNIFSQGDLLDSFSSEYANTIRPERKTRHMVDGKDVSGMFDIPVAPGRDRCLSQYQAVYQYLPEVYRARIRMDDPVASVDAKVDAAQLRSYLGFFDFVITSVQRTLEHITEPFSLYQYQPFLLGDTSTSQLSGISSVDYLQGKKVDESTDLQEKRFSEQLKSAHRIMDRQLQNMGFKSSHLGLGNITNIDKSQDLNAVNRISLRLYQIKRDYLGLLHQGSDFLNTVNGLESSVNHRNMISKDSAVGATTNIAIDFLVKKLTLQIEAIYLKNGLTYKEGDCFFYLLDHIDQFNAGANGNYPKLAHGNGLSFFIPADPGAVYLSGLCFEGAGQAFAESFQWPPAKAKAGLSLTIEMMVLVPEGKTGIQTLFSIGNEGGSNRFQVHLVDTDGWMHFDYGPGGNRVSVDFKGYFNRWVHLAVSVDAGVRGMLTIHLDGKQVEQEPFYDYPAEPLRGFHLGHRQADVDTCYSFWGRVADVRFWSKQRTTQELVESRGKVFDAGTAHLELYLPLGKGNCLDFSGHQHTIVLTPEVQFCDDEPSRVDFDENEEDEFISAYEQISRRLLNELPAHLPVNFYCLSDRLYQWLGRSFNSPSNIIEGRQQALEHYVLFMERCCRDKEIITGDRIGHLVVFDKIMQWIKSFAKDRALTVELVAEPDYTKAAKFAMVRIQFKQHLGAWYSNYMLTQSNQLSPGNTVAAVEFNPEQIENISNDVIWQTWVDYLKKNSARESMNEVLESDKAPLDSSMAADESTKVITLDYRLVMNHRMEHMEH